MIKQISSYYKRNLKMKTKQQMIKIILQIKTKDNLISIVRINLIQIITFKIKKINNLLMIEKLYSKQIKTIKKMKNHQALIKQNKFQLVKKNLQFLSKKSKMTNLKLFINQTIRRNLILNKMQLK